MQNQAAQIRQYLLKQVVSHSRDIVAHASAHFNVSRTAIQRHLDTLIKTGKLIKIGVTRDAQYFLIEHFDKHAKFNITSGLAEYQVWKDVLEPSCSFLENNVLDISHYGFTEMFNNAIDHSEGQWIILDAKIQNGSIFISIQDNGVGLFKKIAKALQLEDIRESILQLTKGRVTTDPANHTGEGIFFTSRSFDSFQLIANGFKYIRDNLKNDWTFERDGEEPTKGTTVLMQISMHSKRDLTKIFTQYQLDDSLEFNKTEVYVALSKYKEETFISRSQAKRVLMNLEKFKHIILDFKGIRMIGQGFADEVFRVYQQKHPNIQLTYVNANQDITFMIERSLSSTAK